MVYQSDNYYFTIPNRTWSILPKNRQLIHHSAANFTFRLVTGDAISSPFTTSLQIRNVNDPTFLSFSASSSSSAVATKETEMQDSSVSVSLASTDLMANLYSGITLTGFHITDHDLGVSPVRMQINTSNIGEFQLNPTYVDLLDFNSHSYCFAQVYWKCHGSGQGASQYLEFVGLPHNIEKAINGMVYRTYDNRKSVDSNITFTIYDGIGDQCFNGNQLKDGSVYNGCYTTQFTLSVSTSVLCSVHHSFLIIE